LSDKIDPEAMGRIEKAVKELASIDYPHDFCGENWAWKRERTSTTQERSFLRMFAPTVSGSLDRATHVGGLSASEHAKNLARSLLGERGRHVLKRGRGLVRGRLER
jgi:hypothetical protein